MSDGVTVTFVDPTGKAADRERSAAIGETFLEVAQAAGLELPATGGGRVPQPRIIKAAAASAGLTAAPRLPRGRLPSPVRQSAHSSFTEAAICLTGSERRGR